MKKSYYYDDLGHKFILISFLIIMSILAINTVTTTHSAYGSINPPLSSTMDEAVQDVLSDLTLVSVNRTSGEDRVLAPVYQFTQTNGSGNPDFRVFHYIWQESPEHYDLEAVVGIKPVENGYEVEVSKLTNRAIKVDLGDKSGVIPSTNNTAKVSQGFVVFIIPK